MKKPQKTINNKKDSAFLEDLCRTSGVKLTQQRLTLLRVLAVSNDHPCVEEILCRVQYLDKDVSMATVYRTMKLLEEKGVVRCLDLNDGRARYEIADFNQHHHHLVDIDTHEVIEFADKDLESIIHKIAAKRGYKIAGDRLTLYVEKIS